jgi:hypothetical protein
VLASTRNGDRACLGIDAVLNEFGDGLERAALRERNDGNGVPIVPNLESAASLVALLLRHRCTMPLSANAAFIRIYGTITNAAGGGVYLQKKGKLSYVT